MLQAHIYIIFASSEKKYPKKGEQKGELLQAVSCEVSLHKQLFVRLLLTCHILLTLFT